MPSSIWSFGIHVLSWASVLGPGTSNAQTTTTTTASGYFPGQYPLAAASGYEQSDSCEQSCMSENSQFASFDDAKNSCVGLVNLLYDVAPCITEVCSEDSVAVYDVQTVLASYCTSLASSAVAPATTFSIPVVVPTVGVVISSDSASSIATSTTAVSATTSTASSSATSPSTASSTASVAAAHSSTSSLSGGDIAGIVVGVLAGLGIIATAMVFWLRRGRRRQQPQTEPQYPSGRSELGGVPLAPAKVITSNEKSHELQDSGIHEAQDSGVHEAQDSGLLEAHATMKPVQTDDGRFPAELEGKSRV